IKFSTSHNFRIESDAMVENSERVIDLAAPEVLDLSRHLRYEAFLLPICTSLILLSDIIIALGSFILAYNLRQGEAVFFRPHGMFLPVDITWGFRPYFS